MKSESKSKAERIIYRIVVTIALVVVALCIYTVLFVTSLQQRPWRQRMYTSCGSNYAIKPIITFIPPCKPVKTSMAYKNNRK